jgi:hypothetical protein
MGVVWVWGSSRMYGNATAISSREFQELGSLISGAVVVDVHSRILVATEHCSVSKHV